MNCNFTGMNFLAHAYLSFDHPQILVGNMISDFVKGAAKSTYEKDIRQGIMLHRHIDTYTDRHPAIKKAQEYFRPAFRLYSGPIIDVVFDHYVALEIEKTNPGSLRDFSVNVYQVLEDHKENLPANFLHVMKYMKKDDWLGNYSKMEGIRQSLKGLIMRAAYLNDSAPAYELFMKHYDVLGSHFEEFFPDVKHYAKQKMEELLD
jgi:acyl carrier protein phosphodiesterase